MNGSPLQWYSHETAITKHYAYLLQQVEEALDLATHIWGRFEIDDKEEWERVPPLQEALQSAEKLALYYRSNEASLTRKQTFSYLIFCQAYNGFDTYVERIVRHAPRRHQPANRNISQLEKRSYDLKQNGIDFLVNADDYLRVNTIRECRNLITHNQGIITQAFNGIFPTVPPGVGQRIRLYPVDVADDANFLLRECFRLDDLAAQQFGIERKVFPAWQEHYRYERKV